jgi:hypothetical protein
LSPSHNRGERRCCTGWSWRHRIIRRPPVILRGIKGIVVAIGSIVAAIVCGLVAAMKGRNPLGWGILGLFFGIRTLTVIIVIPSKRSNPTRRHPVRIQA